METHTYVEDYPGYTILDYWKRTSGILGYSGDNQSIGIYSEADYDFELLSANELKVNVITYAYNITSDGSGNSLNVWLPKHHNDLESAYSVYLKGAPTSTVEVESEDAFVVWPNPY